jgi:hypothetical protein
MAVVITSKFYQDSAWKDISKVVFTSPNIDSPAIAGTRSHILPGEGALGMWYEDTSEMFRVEASQTTTSTDYYNFRFTSTALVDLSSFPTTVAVSGTTASYDVFYDYMKDSVGCSPIGYTAVNMSTAVEEVRVKLEYSPEEGATDTDMGYVNNVYTTEEVTPGVQTGYDVYGISTNFETSDTFQKAWVVSVITGEEECYLEVDMDKPYKVTKIYMTGQSSWDDSGSDYLNKRFFGNYVIYGKLNQSDSWTTLYTGANTTNVDATIFLSSTAGFYKYYKITIQNNTGLSGFTSTYYALSGLQFYTYTYNDIPSVEKAIYSSISNGEHNVVYISDIEELSFNNYQLNITNSTSSGTLPSGTEFKSWGSLSSDIDFTVNDSITFEVTTGEAYNCRLTAWDDVTHSTTVNELLQGDHVRCSAVAYCSTGEKLVPTESYDPINYVYGPVHNRILKGNVSDGGYNYYFGDFDMVYRYQSDIYGDFLIFKPMLYGINSGISYGVHDYVITLHYSYT